MPDRACGGIITTPATLEHLSHLDVGHIGTTEPPQELTLDKPPKAPGKA
jgi:hypothetical protein